MVFWGYIEIIFESQGMEGRATRKEDREGGGGVGINEFFLQILA